MRPTAFHLEHWKAPMKEKDWYLDAAKAVSRHLDCLKVPCLVPMIAKGWNLVAVMEPLTPTADHLGRLKDPLKAMGCYLE